MADAFAWRLVAAFLPRTDQLSLLAVNQALALSSLRRDLFQSTTWCIPVTKPAAERVLQSLTMRSSVRHVVLYAAWQQELLAQLPALASVYFDAQNDVDTLVLSRHIPASVTALRVTGVHTVSFADVGHLENLQALHIQATSVEHTEPLWNLPKLQHVRLEWMDDPSFVKFLRHITVLNVQGGMVDAADVSVLLDLQELTLKMCEIGEFAALRSIAPRLRVVDLQDSMVTDGISTMDKLEFVSMLKVVEHLDLRGTDFINYESLDVVRELTQLRELHLSKSFRDLEPLIGLKDLEVLTLVGTPTTDWSVIGSLKKLHTVNQCSSMDDEHDNPTSMPALQTLPNFKRLEGATKLSKDHPLVHLREIEVVGGRSRLITLQAGEYPTVFKLKVVNLVDMASLVQSFPNVTTLSLFANADASNLSGLSSIRVLTSLTSLQIFGRASNLGFLGDLAFLGHLVNLEELKLVSLRIEDVSGLSELTKLRELSLRGSSVPDITALAGLHELRDLRLDWTQVRDVSCLRDHPHLKTLSLPKGVDHSSLITEDGDVALPCVIRISCNERTLWPPSKA